MRGIFWLSAVAALAACSNGSTNDGGGPGVDAAAPSADAGGDAASAADAGTDADASDSGLDLDLCSEEGWCQTLLGTKDDLVDIWEDGAGAAWAIGSGPSGASGLDAAKIYRWDGAAWSLQATLKDLQLTAIWGRGPTDLTIAGIHILGTYDVNNDFDTPGIILRGLGSAPNAITWTMSTVTRPLAGNVSMGRVFGDGTNTWVAGTESSTTNPRGFVLRLADGAGGAVTTTTEYFAPAATATVLSRALGALWGGGGDVWVGGSDVDGGAPASPVVLHRTVSAGGTVTWQRDITLGTVMTGVVAGTALGGGKSAVGGVHGDAPTACSAVQVGGPPTWSSAPMPNCEEPVTVYGTATSLWAAGGGPLREWNGTAWRLARTSPKNHPLQIASAVRSIRGSGPDDIWAVGDQGLALHKGKGSTP